MADTEEINSEKLWDTIVRFEGHSFRTFRGLEFFYKIKRDRKGELTKELFFDRKDKGITFATIELALKNGIDEQNMNGYVKGPKKLKVFGASYIYPMLAEFGMIRTKCEEGAGEK